jgi:hypothetical protein
MLMAKISELNKNDNLIGEYNMKMKNSGISEETDTNDKTTQARA